VSDLPPTKGLTDKQKRFVAEYAIDHNATQAAIRAGYAPKAAQEQSSRLLSKAIVKEAVAAYERPIYQRLGLTLENALEEHRRLAFLTIRELFDEHGELRPIGEWPAAVFEAAPLIGVLLSAKRQANEKLLTIFKDRGEYGPPPPAERNVTINQQNIRYVPLEQLTDEELAFYQRLLESGRAATIDMPVAKKGASGR
jgi:terminase small subunit-like protein